jgi:hypothetical protein
MAKLFTITLLVVRILTLVFRFLANANPAIFPLSNVIKNQQMVYKA